MDRLGRSLRYKTNWIEATSKAIRKGTYGNLKLPHAIGDSNVDDAEEYRRDVLLKIERNKSYVTRVAADLRLLRLYQQSPGTDAACVHQTLALEKEYYSFLKGILGHRAKEVFNSDRVWGALISDIFDKDHRDYYEKYDKLLKKRQGKSKTNGRVLITD